MRVVSTQVVVAFTRPLAPSTSPPHSTLAMARKTVAPMEPPIQVGPFGHTWRWGSAVGCVGEAIPPWKLLAIYHGVGFFSKSTRLGRRPLHTLRQAPTALGGWRTPKGTQPHHMASYGPMGGEV